MVTIQTNSSETEKDNNQRIQEDRGWKNLLILGIVASGIAIATTSVSLIIYHNSGDIYLDRSRPGFLPDETEIQPIIEEDYSVSPSGRLTEKDLDDFISHFEENIEMIDDLENPFSEVPLSDESLGIPIGE